MFIKTQKRKDDLYLRYFLRSYSPFCIANNTDVDKIRHYLKKWDEKSDTLGFNSEKAPKRIRFEGHGGPDEDDKKKKKKTPMKINKLASKKNHGLS